MEALILAGGRSEHLPVPHKADLPFDGRTMLEHVAGALAQVQGVERVTIVRDAGPTLLDNLLGGLRQLGVPTRSHVLISSCDIPFLTPAGVEDFLRQCDPKADVCYPIIAREICEERFPGVRRTYARLREGTFTGGNLFVVRAGAMPALADRLERIFARRKSPLKLAGELGALLTVQFLFSMWLGTLSIAKLEGHVAKLTGLHCQAVPSTFAEIGTDIDKLSDLDLLRAT